MPRKVKLEDVFEKTAKFLEKYKIPYFIIGGIAAGMLGEPRATGDVEKLKMKNQKLKTHIKNIKIFSYLHLCF
jgi:Na+/glutamate symporter